MNIPDMTVIKWLFKFPPHLTSASALPRKNRTFVWWPVMPGIFLPKNYQNLVNLVQVTVSGSYFKTQCSFPIIALQLSWYYVVVPQLLLATLAAFGIFVLFYIIALIFSFVYRYRLVVAWFGVSFALWSTILQCFFLLIHDCYVLNFLVLL